MEVVNGPLAVRSSSLLEDSHYQPFAGVYSTYMIPYVTDKYKRIELLAYAVKAVYASVYYQSSKDPFLPPALHLFPGHQTSQ